MSHQDCTLQSTRPAEKQLVLGETYTVQHNKQKTHPTEQQAAYTTVNKTSRCNNVPHNRFLPQIDNSFYESVMAMLGDCERIKALCVRKHTFFS